MEKVKCVLFSIILCFGIVATRSIPCLASSYVIDPSTIGSIGDLAFGLLGGAEFDFTGSKYQIEDYSSLSQGDQIDAAIGATNSFIEDYYTARKEYIKANVGFLAESNKVYDNYALRDSGLINADTNFTITNQLVTDWMQYSKFWYNKYIEDFTEGVITSNVPDDYLSLVTDLYQFNISGVDLLNASLQYNTQYWNNRSEYSYYIPNHNNGFRFTNTNCNICACTKATIVISGNDNDGWSMTCLSTKTTPWGGSSGSRDHIAGLYNRGNNVIDISFSNTNIGNPPSYYAGSTLSDVLNYVYLHYRNIYLTVNSVPWVLGDPTALIPDFPDVIGTDDDPIYTFDLPDTSTFEGAFDVTSLFDAIKEAIIGASDTDASTSGILSGEDVSDLVVDDTGTLVGTKAVPISTVFDNSIEGEATKRLPNIELYPDKIHDAFSGTTLLADVVLATQESLPSQLIIVFWGIVIVLIIIALVKSLHR